MANDSTPKLDKDLLGRISQQALSVYKDRGYSDGSRYLEPNEMITRAYCEAFLAVMASRGFVLVKTTSNS